MRQQKKRGQDEFNQINIDTFSSLVDKLLSLDRSLSILTLAFLIFSFDHPSNPEVTIDQSINQTGNHRIIQEQEIFRP
jgi:hypothetical protein